MKKQNPQSLILLALALLLPAAASAEDRLYRYFNEQGNVVVDQQIPNEFLHGGYEVINEKGVVLEVVPRALTPEEQAIENARKRAEEEAVAEENRLKAWDESLLLRYSTVEDIEAARERALDSLRIRLSILSSNRRSLIQRVENYQAQAAEIERSGAKVDKLRLQTVQELQEQIGVTERAIVERQGEIEEVSKIFQADIDRFALLQDMVEFRRSASLEED
jgi:hypothetical protein